MFEPPASLKKFQNDYSQYLRSPTTYALPKKIPERASKIYEGLLFNNLCGFLDKCFPVARKLLGDADWRKLCRTFFTDWSCHKPYFAQIPYEFVQYLQIQQQALQLPPWLAELVDYEWRELEVDLENIDVAPIKLPSSEHFTIKLNPSLKNLEYQWPVHRITVEQIPQNPQPTFLLIYRTYDHQVRFMEVNAVTSALLQILNDNILSPQQALKQLSNLLPTIPETTLQDFGQPLILNLLHEGVLHLHAPG